MPRRFPRTVRGVNDTTLSGVSVLVAGAGLAGLAAARDLIALGATVTVIDVRDRVGGRVWTIRDGFAEGQHAEAGGDFIDEEQHEIRNRGSRARAQADAHPQRRVRLRPRRSDRPRQDCRAQCQAWLGTAGGPIARGQPAVHARRTALGLADHRRPGAAFGVGVAGSGQGRRGPADDRGRPARLLSRRPRRAVADCADRSVFRERRRRAWRHVSHRRRHRPPRRWPSPSRSANGSI